MLVGIGERGEGTADTVEADLTRDHGGDLDLALGDVAQGVGELRRVVSEREVHPKRN